MTGTSHSHGTRTISIIVPCLNCSETIGGLVFSMRQQRLPDHTELEILVVDNGSERATLEILEHLPAKVLHETTPGAAAARNAGLRAANGEVIIFMDADTRPVGGHFILEHLRTLDISEDIGIAGGAITHDPEQHSLLAFAENATGLFNWHEARPPGYLTFQPLGNLAIRKEVVAQIGLLDEGLLWLEDFEWNARAGRAGYRIYFNPGAAVYIRGRVSLGEILGKFYRWGLNIRGTYLPGRLDQVWLFKNHDGLFYLNAPLRVLNETWVTMKRWYSVYPLKTLFALPLVVLFRAAWGLGMIVGAHRFFSEAKHRRQNTLRHTDHG